MDGRIKLNPKTSIFHRSKLFPFILSWHFTRLNTTYILLYFLQIYLQCRSARCVTTGQALARLAAVTIFRHPSSFVSNYQPHWLIRCNQHYMVRFNETPNNQKCPYNPLSAARTMLYRRRDVWGCRFFFFLQLTLSVKKRTLGEKRRAKMQPEILMLCSKVIQIMKTPNTIHLSVVHMSRKSLPGIVWCETIHVNFSWYAHCE